MDIRRTCDGRTWVWLGQQRYQTSLQQDARWKTSVVDVDRLTQNKTSTNNWRTEWATINKKSCSLPACINKNLSNISNKVLCLSSARISGLLQPRQDLDRRRSLTIRNLFPVYGKRRGGRIGREREWCGWHRPGIKGHGIAAIPMGPSTVVYQCTITHAGIPPYCQFESMSLGKREPLSNIPDTC